MDATLAQFRAEAVCAVTGWDGTLLRVRRMRTDLFPDTKQEGAAYKWTRFSVIDLCQARCVSKLEQMGFGPDDAVGISHHLRLAFSIKAKGGDFASLAIIRPGAPRSGIPQTIQWADPQTTLAATLMDESDREIAAVIDCAEVARAVMRILREGGYLKDSD